MNRDDTVRIFLYAPREEKVRRLLARGKTDQEAQNLVDTVDRERADYIEKYFKVEWPNRSLYHAMINTAIGDEIVVRTILNVVEAFDSRSTAQV
jgi:cytidylate kinase